MRASRQVHTNTPHVLGDPHASANENDTVGMGRPKGRRAADSSRPGTRSTRRSSYPKRRAAERPKRGIGFKLLILLLIAIALAGGFVALYFSSLFTITDVRVSGNTRLESSYVAELADVPEDSTILRTDTEGIRSRLLTEPWILDVKVERSFPSTLVLNVTEQPVAAVVDIVPETATDSTQQWLLSESGIWIAQVNGTSSAGAQTRAEELAGMLKITDVSAAVRPEAGALEADEGITNALALLQGFSEEMRGMVASISAPDAAKTTMTLYNNVGVAIGFAEDIQAKEQAIATLLAEHEGTITYINVRVADRPYYRATE